MQNEVLGAPYGAEWIGVASMLKAKKILIFMTALATVGAFGMAEAAVGVTSNSQAGALNCNPRGVQDSDGGSGATYAESSATSAIHGSQAWSSASLATGKIRIFGSNAFSHGCSVARGSGQIQDQITVDLPDGMETAEVEFSFAITGESSPLSNNDRGSATLNVDGVASFFALGESLLSDVYGRSLTYRRSVFDGEQIDISASLSAIRRFEAGTIDLTHTGAFRLSLPTGARFTSQSGVFLSQAGIPEPATWSSMILGFGAAGGMMRKARRPRVCST